MKIVICGSMTASKEMFEAKKKLIDLGHEVVLPDFTEEYAVMNTEDEMHLESAKNKVKHDLIRGYYEKIKESDAILVVNVERKGISGYIGGNSFLEIGFAHVLNKKIYLLNDIPNSSFRDELEAMQPVVVNNEYSKIF